MDNIAVLEQKVKETRKAWKALDEDDEDKEAAEEAYDKAKDAKNDAENALINEEETFLTTEIPYLMFQALEWISDRVAKKRNDKVWMENFMQAKDSKRTDINKQYTDAVKQLT